MAVALACLCLLLASGVQTEDPNPPTPCEPYRPRDVHPQCTGGTWQQRYWQVECETARQAPEDQRYAVYLANRNGLSNRIVGLVTAFVYALLTGRAFRIEWLHLPPLEAALEYATFNWTASPSVLDPELGGGLAELNYSLIFFYGHKETNDFLWRDFAAVNASARTVRVDIDQGQIWSLFLNEHHRRAVFALGLRPDTAFGCLVRYLFRPTPATLQVLAPLWRALLVHETEATFAYLPQYLKTGLNLSAADLLPNPKLRIGIQVRYGDSAFDPKRHKRFCQRALKRNPLSQAFFHCAEQLEQTLGREAVYLLISDCDTLRRSAAERYGPQKLLTYLPANHTLAPTHVIGGGLPALLLAASEFWLFAHTDYQVITGLSGFGRLAAFLSLNWLQTYTVYAPERPRCDRFTYDQWRELTHQWTRV